MPLVLPRLLTIDETAVVLNLKRSTIVQWVATHRIVSLRLPNGNVRIRASEIDRLERTAWRPPRNLR
jgi:excisionase family DNA binding protein